MSSSLLRSLNSEREKRPFRASSIIADTGRRVAVVVVVVVVVAIVMDDDFISSVNVSVDTEMAMGERRAKVCGGDDGVCSLESVQASLWVDQCARWCSTPQYRIVRQAPHHSNLSFDPHTIHWLVFICHRPSPRDVNYKKKNQTFFPTTTPSRLKKKNKFLFLGNCKKKKKKKSPHTIFFNYTKRK